MNVIGAALNFQMSEMSSKVAVVTGSNKGIGLAIVRVLCRQFDGIVYLLNSQVTGHTELLCMNEMASQWTSNWEWKRLVFPSITATLPSSLLDCSIHFYDLLLAVRGAPPL